MRKNFSYGFFREVANGISDAFSLFAEFVGGIYEQVQQNPWVLFIVLFAVFAPIVVLIIDFVVDWAKVIGSKGNLTPFGGHLNGHANNFYVPNYYSNFKASDIQLLGKKIRKNNEEQRRKDERDEQFALSSAEAEKFFSHNATARSVKTSYGFVHLRQGYENIDWSNKVRINDTVSRTVVNKNGIRHIKSVNSSHSLMRDDNYKIDS